MHCACHPSQFLAEHFCAELPTLGALAAPLTQLSIAVQVFFFYYNAHKKTKGPKSLVWAGVAMFFAGLAFFGGLEVGLPKDTPAEQAVANLDPTHALWHLLLHTYLVMHAAVVTYNVPWETKEVTSTPSLQSFKCVPNVPWETQECPSSPCPTSPRSPTRMAKSFKAA